MVTPAPPTRTHDKVNEITGIIPGSGDPGGLWTLPGCGDASNTTLASEKRDAIFDFRPAICFLTLLTLLFFGFASGCSWETSHGTRRHLVIGFGVVDVDPPGQGVSAQGDVDLIASRWKAAGILLGHGPHVGGLGIGVFEHQSIEVAPESDLIVDWHSDNGKPAQLQIERAR